MIKSHVLCNLHKNLQRLPSLAFCIAKASVSRQVPAGQLAKTYDDMLTRLVSVDSGSLDRVSAYLSERAMVQKYDRKRGGTVETIRENMAAGEGIEIQDWFLSDPSLPSRTGAEKEISFVRTVAACQELELLRSKTSTLLAYGEVLLAIAHERGLFRALEEKTRNPFLPDPPFVTAAYLQVLLHDFSFQRHLLARIDGSECSFVDIANQLHEILIDVQTSVPPTAANRVLQSWLKKQREAATRLNRRLVDKDKKGPLTYTLYRPVEDLLYSRLEFLVDFGALDKPHPGRYVYRRGVAYDELVSTISAGEDGIRTRYFRTVGSARKRSVRSIHDRTEVLDHLLGAYKKFKNVAGYAPILECVVYANASTWDEEPWAVVEVADAFDVLADLAREVPPRVRINPDRFRRPFTFKVTD